MEYFIYLCRLKGQKPAFSEMKNQGHRTICVGGRLMDLSQPRVMGILNATPDSFYSASRTQDEQAVAARAEAILTEGGDIIDVGAFSTRPGATVVDPAEEMARLRWALSIIRREHPSAVVSVDTFRPEVAQMAVEEYGADIINDVTEGTGMMGVAGTGAPSAMFAMVARLHVPYILTSVQPGIAPMLSAFALEVQQLHDLGVSDILLDPGFGFGKTLEQNYEVMVHLSRLGALGLPVLVGVSRKSMVTRLVGCTAEEALAGTTALHALALARGASVLRVHDVGAAVQAVACTMRCIDPDIFSIH